MSIIASLHDNICKAIQGAHSNVYVAAFPDIKKTIKLPAILIEMAEMRPGDADMGTEQLGMNAIFEARCMIDASTHGHMAVRDLAASVAYQVYTNGRFGLPVMPAKITSVSPDHLSPDIDAYMVWMVEWSHQINLGPNMWDNGILPREVHLGKPPSKTIQRLPEGVLVPHEIWYSVEPLVGRAHLEYYEEVPDNGR